MSKNTTMQQQQQQPQFPDMTYKFNASMAIIVVVLVITFFFMALFVLYIRRCNLASVANLDWATQNRMGAMARVHPPQQQQQPPQRGIDPDTLRKLPLLRFASLKSVKRGRAGSDCAVCLLPFEEEAQLRLLPSCGHLFHAECIDLWLDTHVTCPLCRRNAAPTPPAGDQTQAANAVTADAELGQTVAANAETEDVEQQATAPNAGTADAELRQATAADAQQGGSDGHLQRTLSAVMRSFRRETPTTEEAAQGETGIAAVRTLSKNSDSFRLAAHELELLEVREKIRARSKRFQSARFPIAISEEEQMSSSSSSLQQIQQQQQQQQQQIQQPQSPLRRSVSDGEALLLSFGNGNSGSGSGSGSRRVLFPAFARRSLKWLKP